MKFEIEIRPIKWLYQNPPEMPAGAVIATMYDIRSDRLKPLKSFLALSFADVTDSKNPQSFNHRHAKEICRYIGSLPTDIEKLFICCDSGESRSSAIAAAILRHYGEDDMHIWQNPRFHPNPLVYSILCGGLGCTVTCSELDERIKTNDGALTEIIQRKRKTATPENVIDIHSKGEYPSCALSNFYEHPFVIDSVRCSSMEGFLQSLKFRSINKQKKVCLLSGKEAKNSARHTLAQLRWRITQTLYWQGVVYRRNSEEYKQLLDRAYDGISKNTAFITALKASANAELMHTIGSNDPKKTVLTEEEFVSQLKRIRQKI